jgi:hypothetical protein
MIAMNPYLTEACSLGLHFTCQSTSCHFLCALYVCLMLACVCFNPRLERFVLLVVAKHAIAAIRLDCER